MRAAAYPVAELHPRSMPRPARASVKAPTAIRASELKAKEFKPIAWVVVDVIPDGLTMLASKPKVGKSWLMLDASVAVARGGFTLDRKCIPGDVLYAALEDNERRLKGRMVKVCPIGDWPARLTFWTEMSALEEGGLEQLKDWITSAKAAGKGAVVRLRELQPTRVVRLSPYEVRVGKMMAEAKDRADARARAGVINSVVRL